MKLMIVDDDFQIREGMKYGVEWERLGIDEVTSCANGIEALEYFRGIQPDIILTDVQMPGMSGLELIAKIRELDDKVRVIFISAYSEFEYCRQALKLGADDYILKPIEFEKLEDMIRKNIEIIRTREREDLRYRRFRLEKEMQDIYLDGIRDGKNLCQLIKDEYPFVEEGHFLTVVLTISKKDKRLYKDGWTQNFESILFESKQGIVLLKLENEIVVLTQGSNSELLAVYLQSELKNRLFSWNQIYGDRFGHISAGISRAHDVTDFRRGYIEAKRALEHGFYTDTESILIWPVEYKIKDIKLDEKDALQKMSEALESDTYERAEKELYGYEELLRKNPVEPSALKTFGWNAYRKLAKEKHMPVSENDPPEDLQECICLKEYFEIMNACIFKLWKRLRQTADETRYSNTVKIALNYVARHYGEPLTLSQVAEAVGKSANYFSGIFKKETGQYFTEYLTQYRMNEARRLLSETNMKIKDISEKVGYTDYVYFSNVFRKTFQCSASQLRRQVRENEEE